jgi:CHASE3 domain sensor protein
MRIGTKLLSISLANAAFVIILGGASLFGVIRLLEAGEWVEHSNQVIDSTQEMAFNLADTTASERAYLITEQEMYYQRFKESSEKTTLSLTKVNELVGDNKQQQERLRLMKAIVKERLDSFDDTTDLFRSGNKSGALDRVKHGKGLVFMTKIGTMIDEFRAEELKLLDHRKAEMEKNGESLKRTIIFGTLAAIISVSLFNLMLAHNVVGWVRLLKTATDNIERGRFETRAPTHTADEFAEIAIAFNRLGHSIQIAFDTQPQEIAQARKSLREVYEAARHVDDWARCAMEQARQAQLALGALVASGGELKISAPKLIERSQGSLATAQEISGSMRNLNEVVASIDNAAGELAMISLQSQMEAARYEKELPATFAPLMLQLKTLAQRMRDDNLRAQHFMNDLQGQGLRLVSEERDEHISVESLDRAFQSLLTNLDLCVEAVNLSSNAITNLMELSGKNSSSVTAGRGSLERLWNDFERRQAKIQAASELGNTGVYRKVAVAPD